MAYLHVGQSRIYYESHGEGLPLVLAHGVGGNHASWFQQIAGLADRFRLVIFDHRGFGNSTDTEQLGRAAFTDDLARLLDTLGIETSVLVGQSMGGGTCLSFACRHPDRVRGLVLADSLVGVDLPEDLRPAMQQVMSATAHLTQPERVLGLTTRQQRPVLSLLYTQIASFNAVTLRTLAGQAALHSLQDLAATGVPTLFLVGEEDILFPPSLIRAVQGRLPASCFIALAGAGHSAHFEAPEAFNAALSSWLREIAPGSHSKPPTTRSATD